MIGGPIGWPIGGVVVLDTGVKTLVTTKHTNVNTIYAPTVVKETYVVSPTLYVDADQFGTDKIIYVLHAPSYTDPDTFYPILVTNAFLVKPARFQNQTTFGTFNSNYTVYGNLFDDADTFYTANAIRLLKPTLLLDTDTFYTPIVHGFFAIRPDLYVDSDSFGVPKIVYTIYPTRDVNLQTFYIPSLEGLNQVFPTRYIDQDVFPPVTVHAIYDLYPTLHSDPDVFYNFFTKQIFSAVQEKPFRFQRYSNLRGSGAPIYTTLRKFTV